MSKKDNAVLIDKGLVYSLPKDRSYTKLEAMFSYTVDIDNNVNGSVNGYAKLWGWSNWKVNRFINEIKAKTGHRQFTNNSPTTYQQPVFLKNNNLQKQTNNSPTKDQQFTNTTIYKDNIYILFFKQFNLPDLKIEKLLKYKNQLTEKQLISLIEKYGKQLVCDKLLAMENNKKLYDDVYLTCNNWCKSELERKQSGYRKSQSDHNAGGTGKVVF